MLSIARILGHREIYNLCHAFAKKTQEVPRKEIKLAGRTEKMTISGEGDNY